jgi:N-acetylmuramoyl-L-alanine amidase
MWGKAILYRIIVRTVFALFLFLFSLLINSPSLYALTLDNVRFGLHTDKTRMVLDLSSKAEYRVFTLDNPYRIVIDLPEFNWNVENVSKPVKSPVGDIRQGLLKPGFSRIVVDLKSPINIKNVFLLPTDNIKPNRLVIDFNSTSISSFAESKGKTFGSLEPGPLSHVKIADSHSQAHQKDLENHKAASDNSVIKPTEKPSVAPVQAYKKPLIIIDPGHGGRDPGAINKAKGIKEKNITLAMSKELKQILEATKRYDVKLTRTTDKGMRLAERVEIARKHNADLFISIHADSIAKTNVRGASIYTLSEKASDEQTAMLAEKENSVDLIWGVEVDDPEVEKILLDMVREYIKNRSKFFAKTVVTEFNENKINMLEKPHRHAGFAVLKAPDIPSILIELGFISNNYEANLLNKPHYRKEIAHALVEGIDAYFQRVHLEDKS